MANRKGQGLSINMLVIIALAVFVVFIVLGFTTGGWTRFAGLFGAATTGAGSGIDAAAITCDNYCSLYVNAGSPTVAGGDTWDKRLISVRTDIDIDGDGFADTCDSLGCEDGYYCVKDPGVTGTLEKDPKNFAAEGPISTCRINT